MRSPRSKAANERLGWHSALEDDHGGFEEASASPRCPSAVFTVGAASAQNSSERWTSMANRLHPLRKDWTTRPTCRDYLAHPDLVIFGVSGLMSASLILLLCTLGLRDGFDMWQWSKEPWVVSGCNAILSGVAYRGDCGNETEVNGKLSFDVRPFYDYVECPGVQNSTRNDDCLMAFRKGYESLGRRLESPHSSNYKRWTEGINKRRREAHLNHRTARNFAGGGVHHDSYVCADSFLPWVLLRRPTGEEVCAFSNGAEELSSFDTLHEAEAARTLAGLTDHCWTLQLNSIIGDLCDFIFAFEDPSTWPEATEEASRTTKAERSLKLCALILAGTAAALFVCHIRERRLRRPTTRDGERFWKKPLRSRLKQAIESLGILSGSQQDYMPVNSADADDEEVVELGRGEVRSLAD